MANKTYCVNPSCAKPIEYNYEKPKFCPSCGCSLTGFRPAPAPTPSVARVVHQPAQQSAFIPQFQQVNPALAAVQRKMEARKNRNNEEDEDDEDFEEESNAHIDFNNFQFKATVRVPQEQKMTLGDYVKKDDK
jgi:hypothetical protein